MKTFHFTLEAVRILRQRQEHEALEQYARALLARQQVLGLLQDMDARIDRDCSRLRQCLDSGCTAGQAAQAQSFHRSLQKRRDDCLTALGLAERRVNVASKAMLFARQQREIVDAYRDKQRAAHQRLGLREEQKIQDEFAIRRVTALNSARTRSTHD
jgi:flagellar export protein FliJ